MASLDFNKIKRWAFFLFSAWVLLAFIAWHYESTCGMFLSGACWAELWDGARHVVLLKWVKEYQTLVAGMFALLGASFVLITAWKNEDNEKRRSQRKASQICNIVAGQFEMAGNAVHAIWYEDRPLQTPDGVFYSAPAPYLADLHAISPILGDLVTTMKTRADIAIRSPTAKNINVAGDCYVLAKILKYISINISNDSTFDISTNKRIPSGDLADTLQSHAISKRLLGEVGGYIDWDN